MSGTQPKRFCHFDRCHEFEPGSWNAIYCPDCRCKRRAENSLKRLSTLPHADEELWERQENAKLARADHSAQKNDYLLNTRRIVFFDIETFDLAADFGLVMVGCIKERGGETTTFVAHGDVDERECILGVRDTLEAADYVVTYYGTGFDLPYLNTRLIIHGERPLHQIRHVDLYYKVRHGLKLNRNRLDNVEDALFGDEAKLKTRIKPGIWRRALQGNQDALDYIVHHCVADVELLEKAFNKMVGFINLSATRIRRYGGSY